MNRNTNRKILFFGVAGLFLACNTDPSDTKVPEMVAKRGSFKSLEGFYAIPSPVEQAQLLVNAGVNYEVDVLNPIENVSRYSVTNSKALNLGVYASDLSYTAVFNKPQDVIQYLNVSRKLADELNIKQDFYGKSMERMNRNSGNKDSILEIVSDVYNHSNKALKENDQSHISALVVTGGFIEAMYIATRVTDDLSSNNEINARIAEFKNSLNGLVGLMATVYENDFSNVLADLRSIKMIYDEREDASLTDDQIHRIAKTVKAIRIKITNS